MRQPYLIYKRSIRGKKSYYVKVWDEKKYDYSIRKSILSIKDDIGPKGARFPHTSKAGAVALVQLWMKERPAEKSGDRLDEYLLSFWEEGSPFLKSKALRGKSYSKAYLFDNRTGIKNHFLPYLDEIKKRSILVYQVTPGLLEGFQTYATDKGEIGARRINAIMQAVTVPLSEAHRLGKISENPGTKITKLQEVKASRSIFTPEEVKAFFEKCQDPRHYGINLLAATTGMRQGECRGLQRGDVKDGYIELSHNWQDKEGLKEPKWGSSRLVPLPVSTQKVLSALIEENPFQNDFVFWGSHPDRPIGKRTVSNEFNRIVEEEMEISNRAARGLTFHAWRHWYNSMLRGNVPDHALRKLTGHSDEAMTDRYTAITEDQIKAVSELAEKII